MLKTDKSPFHSIKLISLDRHLVEMIKLYDSGFFPRVFLLNGKKGIGKFTLVFHFLNYIFTKKEVTKYNITEKIIDTNSVFYNSILNESCSDVIFLQAQEGKNIKIDDIRNLKSTLTKSSLTNNPRFIIIDEVEFLNINSANALLKTLEEPSENNFFILINNQQANLLETISSRCLKNNIFLKLSEQKKIIEHLTASKKLNIFIDKTGYLTPGMLLIYADLSGKYKIDVNENILLKLNKLLYGYKKDKNKALVGMSIFLIDQFFYTLVKDNKDNIDFFLNVKSSIVNSINDFILYNLNINSVLISIELKLNKCQIKISI